MASTVEFIQVSFPNKCHLTLSPTFKSNMSAVFWEMAMPSLGKVISCLSLSVGVIKGVSLWTVSISVFLMPFVLIWMVSVIIGVPLTSSTIESIWDCVTLSLRIICVSKWLISSYFQVFKSVTPSCIPNAEIRRTVQPITPKIVIVDLNLLRLMSLMFHFILKLNLFHIFEFSIRPSLFILGGFAFNVAAGDSFIIFAIVKYVHNAELITIKAAT